MSASSVKAQIVVVRDCEWVRFPDLSSAAGPRATSQMARHSISTASKGAKFWLGPHLDARSGNLESF